MKTPDRIVIALAKAFADQARDLELPRGSHAVDDTITVHVKGVLSVAKSTFETKKIALPLNRLLAIVLNRFAVKRDEAQAIVGDIIRKALTLGDQPQPPIAAALADVDAAINKFHARNKGARKRKRGALTGKLELEFVG